MKVINEEKGMCQNMKRIHWSFWVASYKYVKVKGRIQIW